MIRLKVTNIKKVEAALKKYGEDAANEIKSVTKITAQEVEDEAKRFAPVNKLKHGGTLRQSIQTLGKIADKGFTWIVAALQPYSAYQEFGTGGNVKIPEGWGEMASWFKGKGIRNIN